MIAESDISPSFWAEVIAANYVRNRCPSRSLNGKSPFEIWKGKLPDLSHLRIFGSKIYILDKTPGKGKMDHPGKAGLFVGYSESSKVYRIWIPEARKIEVSKDVSFVNENRILKKSHEKNMEQSKDSNDRKCIEIEHGPVNPVQEEQINNFQKDDHELDLEADLNVYSFDEQPFLGFELNPEIRIADQLTNYAKVAEVTVKESLSGSQADEWEQSIITEFKSLIKNKTWEICDYPAK